MLGIPIAYSVLLSGVALMVHLGNSDAQILAQNMLERANSIPLLAVPFFMLAGEIMNAGGLSRRIVDLAIALFGHVRGGLGYVTIVAVCLMASLSMLPVVKAASVNPVYSGVLFVSVGMISLVTPPVGTVRNVVASVGHMKMDQVAHGGVPFCHPWCRRAPAFFASVTKKMALFDFPFLFANEKEADTLVDGPVGKRLHVNISEKGLSGLTSSGRTDEAAQVSRLVRLWRAYA